MSLYLDVIDRKVGVNPSYAADYSHEDFPAAFPYARWVLQQQRYEDYWKWFTGEIWEESIPGARDKSQNAVLKYPLQINLVKTAAMKHSAVLFGETSDKPEPLVPVRVSPKPEFDKTAPSEDIKTKAKKLEQFLNDVWMENNGRVIQNEGGTICQFLGGIVYKLTWEPFSEELEYKIKIEMVLPDFFLPVWDSTNPDNLLEAFIVWRVPAREAELKYGYRFPANASQSDYILYIEHWTKESITITLGGKPIEYAVDITDDEGNVVESETIVYDGVDNPFGFIPMVYIPRERAGGYYGLSIIDDLRGVAREINARMADMGDVIAESSHREVYVRNVPGTIRTRDLGGLRTVTDLGQQIPSMDVPDAFAIDPPSMPESLVNYPEILRKQFLRDAFLSGVAEGEDEGSQRSALTLAFRMWPITSKARVTRNYWTNALVRLNRMIVKIAAYHNVSGITADYLEGVHLHCDWAPMIPRDREQMVNEVTLMLNSNGLSPETALALLGLVPDPAEEMERVREWLEYQSQQQIAQMAAQEKVKVQVQQPMASTGLPKEY